MNSSGFQSRPLVRVEGGAARCSLEQGVREISGQAQVCEDRGPM